MVRNGFSLLSETEVAELSSTARLWKHEKTGAQLLSFCNTDENKVFGVSFRTPPADSTGVAHILEHSVLCGSEKYPVKEPFVELLKGSMQTFLNAFTYPDKTCYPVASANLKDFRNLTDVYLDAVFFPIISENIFQQEGWHIEADSPDGPFSFKGVVYNEMKGAFSSPESVLCRYSLHALFPDTVYGLESGGDPEVIPELTYEAFKNFHATYYHPSNGRFFFWGDDPEEERLEQLNAVLNKFSALEVPSSIGLQKPFAQPKSTTVPFASGEDESGMVVLNWLGPDIMDVEEVLAFRMLDHILLGMPASPLRRALIESGMGEDIAGQGLEAELRQITFDVGLKGVAANSTQQVEDLVLGTLKHITEEGIAQSSVEAAINSVEFSLREKNTGRFPVGLAVMLQALTTWLHDADPLMHICFEEPLASIKNRIASGEAVFENMIRTWFLQNPHRVTVSLVPDTSLAEKQEKEEQARLDALVAPLDADGRKEIVSNTEQLKQWQATPDSEKALESIPRLGKEDLPLTNTSIPNESVPASVPMYFHALPTGGIVYVEAGFDLSAVNASLVPLLPLFGRALLEMGTKKHDFVALNMRIACVTGGMDINTLFLSRLDAPGTKGRLIIEGKTTPDKTKDLFGLIEEILSEANLDQQERFLRMVLEEKARQEHGIIPSGHMVAALRLKSLYSPAAALTEATSGVAQLFYLRELAERARTNWPSVLKELESLRALIFTRRNLEWNITALEDRKTEVQQLANQLAQTLPGNSQESSACTTWLPRADILAEALLLPAQVNYIAKGANLYEQGFTWHASALVVLKYLRTGYLWEKVRVQGGAYGCVCGLDRASGNFFAVSYRDPNTLATLDIYDNTAQFLQSGAISGADIDAAIVGAIGELDTYLLPDAKGHAWYTRHLIGESEEARQQLRDEVLATKKEHFIRFGQALEVMKTNGRIVAVGGQTLKREAQEKGWASQDLL